MGVKIERKIVSASVLLVLLALPLILYFVLFFQYSVNIPFGDDYAVLADALNFTNPYWPAKLPLLFAQFNEHRIVTLRLTMLGLYAVTGKVDFVVIALLGNLGIVGIAVLMCRLLLRREGRWRLLMCLPIPFLLFQPQHHEILNWAQCSFTNVFGVLLSFLSLYLLAGSIERTGPQGRAESPQKFVGAIVFSVLAAYTNGNGIFVFFIGAGILLWGTRGGARQKEEIDLGGNAFGPDDQGIQIEHSPSDKKQSSTGSKSAALAKKRRLLIWLLAGVVYVGFYFVGYSKIPSQTDPFSFLAGTPLAVNEFFLTLLGSAFDFGWEPRWPTLLGSAVLLAGLGFVVARFMRTPSVTLNKGRRRGGPIKYPSDRIGSAGPLAGDQQNSGQYLNQEKSRSHFDRTVLMSWIVFVLFSLVATAVSRAPMGFELAHSPRYRFLSVLAVLLLYAALTKIFTCPAGLKYANVGTGSKRRGPERRWARGFQKEDHSRGPGQRAFVAAFVVFSVAFCALSYGRRFATVRDHKFVLSMNLFDWDRGKADLPYANAEHADRIMRLSVVRKIYSPPAVLNIRGPKFPVGGVDGGDSPIFTGWALDDGGRPSVIVRRSAKGEYVGKAKFRNGSIPKILRDYFGYPGTDRMVWEFRLNMDEFNRADGKSPSVGGRTTLYFFARDRLGRETLIGVRSQHLKN